MIVILAKGLKRSHLMICIMADGYKIRVIPATSRQIESGRHPERASLQALPGKGQRVYVVEEGITASYNADQDSHPRDIALGTVSNLLRDLGQVMDVSDFDITLCMR